MDGQSPVTVALRVISGFGIPRPEAQDKGDIVDPYVVAHIEGPLASRDNTIRTPVITDDGLHPVWNVQEAQVLPPIRVPDASHLVLTVRDSDKVGEDMLVAEAIVPVHALRGGMRSFALHDINGKELLGAFLLVAVELR